MPPEDKTVPVEASITDLPGRCLALAASLWPGLCLATIVTVIAFALRLLPGMSTLSPLILAILLGMALRNLVGTPAVARAGVVFCQKRILRFAIILLGFQLTAAQVASIGGSGVVLLAVALVATFFFTKWMGWLIGVERGLSELIAAGTSICGASAVIAMNTVTQSSDEDVAYAVGCVTVFGSLAMLLYPLLSGIFDLDPRAFGLWTGASIHEIAQVVGAAFQDGQAAGELATIAKLTRVMMLAPLVFGLGIARARQGGGVQGKVAVPWFVLGFVALIIVNSVFAIPAEAKSWLGLLTTFLLSLALAAMGLETNFNKLRANGFRPLLLGGVAWLFIATLSLGLVKLVS